MAFLEHKKLFEASRTFIDVLYIYTAMILHIIQRCYKPVNGMKNLKCLRHVLWTITERSQYIVYGIRWFNACLPVVSI